MISRFSRSIFVVLIIGLCSTFGSTFASAAQVRAIKGKRMLIQLDGAKFWVGEILDVKDGTGHLRALAKVIKISGRFAEAIYRGRPMRGYTVVMRPKNERFKRRPRARSYAAVKKSYGGMLGFNSASASVNLTGGGTVSLSGTGLSALGLMDYPLLDWLSFRGAAGLEQLNLSGATNTNCSGGNACNAKINYLAFDFMGRYVRNSLWGGLGVDIMFPISKSATALETSSISNTMIYVLGAGYDFHLSNGRSYIPIQLEYQIYPSSAQVKANAIEARVGYAKNF